MNLEIKRDIFYDKRVNVLGRPITTYVVTYVTTELPKHMKQNVTEVKGEIVQKQELTTLILHFQ